MKDGYFVTHYHTHSGPAAFADLRTQRFEQCLDVAPCDVCWSGPAIDLFEGSPVLPLHDIIVSLYDTVVKAHALTS